ncbi:uncharacterized protein LOC106383078 isoform X2 [Brassica napus]|uniref:uncharacterized protein LOC106383078 isoform X2 n=1 Tax=Brassica napus TaxID=3708 RepID=UPI00207A40E0|nr:uncharacterized protein LOC106383078 isoform X2 [Brassica napus]
MCLISTNRSLRSSFNCLFIGFGQVKVSSTSSYLFVAEDEHEMRARTIYYTNIDTKAACGEVYRLRLLGDYHHPTRISFVEFVMAESAVTTLNCSGVLLGSLQIRVSPSNTPVCSRAISALPDMVFPFPQSENMNLDDRGGKAWSCGGDASIAVRRFSWVSQYCFLYCEYPTGENVAWLFLGVANTSIILRDDEFLNYLKDHQKNFRFERM